MGALVSLQTRAPEWALARLNRVTGLTFSRMPVSLLSSQPEMAAHTDLSNAIDAHAKARLTEARFKSA